MDYTLSTLVTFTYFMVFLNVADGRYCEFEVDGESKYYICPRNEHCCNFGCCLSPTFQFYQLWYYWLMVIFMFLLCSGGTWWYRYWLQEGRYPPDLGSTMPPPSRIHLQSRNRPTRVSYHPARDAVVLQHVWKPTRTAGLAYTSPPPSYNLAQSLSPVVLSHATPTNSRDAVSYTSPKMKTSPYYQLYGPPPSYESVISETLAERNTVQQQDLSSTRNVSPSSDVQVTHEEGIPQPSSLAVSGSLQNCAANEVPTTSHNGCNEILPLVTDVSQSSSSSKNTDCK